PLADVTIDDYVFRPGVANKASVAKAAGLYWDAGPNGVDDQWFTNHRTVFDANGKLNNVLIYTTGPIELNTPLQGKATFVSTDDIVFNGDGYDLKARDGGVLAFSSAGDRQCGSDAIRFGGGDNMWDGVVYAPSGTIRSCS